MQYRKTQAVINLNAILHNIKQHQNIIGSNKNLMAVVKANGYGHGAIPVLKAAIEQGVTWAGVSSAEEAIQLRKAGFNLPILLMGGWYPEAIPAFLEHDITPSLYSLNQAVLLNEFATKQKRCIGVHLKLETGMGRLGFAENQLSTFLEKLGVFPNIEIEGVFSHLSSADEQITDFTNKQIGIFKKRVKQLKQFTDVKWIHVANSAGTSTIDDGVSNLYRLGISMYGQPTSDHISQKLDLKEAITWKTAIAHLQDYPKGYPISYNRTFHTQKKSIIATVCVGYADGYSRLLSNKGIVLIKGQRAPIVGRVCMDMFMIDVTEIENVSLYDEVVLIGKQGQEYISATEMASWINTINYEVVCNISSRVPRHYQ